MKRFLLCFALALVIAVGAAFAAEAPATFKVSEFTFTRPAAWEWVPAGGMRKAQMKIKDTKGEQGGEVIFFHFGPGQGGGVQANANRWLGQFEEPRDKINAKVDTEEVGGRKVTYVSAEGTYKSGMPGGPMTPLPNHALRGAILECGDGDVFIRMVVPKALIKDAEPEFKKMVASALKK